MNWEELRKGLIDKYNKLLASNAPKTEYAKIISEINIADYVKTNLDKEVLVGRYVKELHRLQKFADVQEDVLQVLIRDDIGYYETKAIESLTVIKKEMSQAAIGGLTMEQFQMIIESVGMSPQQTESLIDDSLKKFSRAIVNEMENNADQEQKYIWAGPVDDRTTDECLQLISAGPMTRDEINNMIPGAFTAGTHFGCRHEPQRYTSRVNLKTDEAHEELKNRVLNTLNPTGSIYTDYTPQVRAKAKLGKNITTLAKTMGVDPNELITIYRGAPPGQKKIVAGDFITTNKQIAQDYAGTGNVIELQVKMGDILDDITEPLGEEYIYRP